MADSKPRLVPARPDAPEEAAAYMPRMPWRWILLGTLGVGTVMGGYWLKEQRRAELLRADIQRVHGQELHEASERYTALRGKLETWILEAAEQAPSDWADERLKIAGLRGGNGLYLRIPAAHADSPEHVAAAASQMTSDAIGSCLGLLPSSARALFESGEFLESDWVDDIRAEDNVMKLRVKDEVLSRHIKADLPVVLDLLRSDWFLLVLEHDGGRHEAPVDVFLWDIRRDQQLLRARIQARGALVGARVVSRDLPRGRVLTPPPGSGATDCSIAAQIKALTGIPLTTVESEFPDGSAAAQAADAAPAANGAAPAPADDEPETPGLEPTEPEPSPE